MVPYTQHLWSNRGFVVYSFTSRVRYSEVDERWDLDVTSIIDYFQDCSTFQSESLGLGPAHILSCGRAWLLAAWEIEVLELPRFGDDIRIGTWATGLKGLMAGRNFVICPADDLRGERPLVRADSTWFLFDSKKGRPTRPLEEDYGAFAEAAQADGDRPLDMPRMERHLRVPAGADAVAAPPVIVTVAHIDTNHHVNNAQYVAMAKAALSEVEPDVDQRLLRRLDVQYSAAARLGDTIYPHVHRIDRGYLVTLDNADEGGRPYAAVRARG